MAATPPMTPTVPSTNWRSTSAIESSTISSVPPIPAARKIRQVWSEEGCGHDKQHVEDHAPHRRGEAGISRDHVPLQQEDERHVDDRDVDADELRDSYRATVRQEPRRGHQPVAGHQGG